MIKLITISGLDGSGKSTQRARIISNLEAGGEKVFYFHSVHFSLPNKMVSYLKKILMPNKKASKTTVKSDVAEVEKAVTKVSALGILIRKLVFPLDVFRFKQLLKKLEKSGYTFIVSDRYFYDNLVNIFYLENKSSYNSKSVYPPDFGFYIKVEPKVIMQRDNPPEQGLKYLEKKHALYMQMAQAEGLSIIDGNQTLEAVFNDIKKVLR